MVCFRAPFWDSSRGSIWGLVRVEGFWVQGLGIRVLGSGLWGFEGFSAGFLGLMDSVS